MKRGQSDSVKVPRGRGVEKKKKVQRRLERQEKAFSSHGSKEYDEPTSAKNIDFAREKTSHRSLFQFL